MNFSAIGPKFLIMTDNYASYNRRIFWNELPNLWGRRIAQVWVLRSTTFFPSPYQHFFYHISTTINNYSSEIFINSPVNITIT